MPSLTIKQESDLYQDAWELHNEIQDDIAAGATEAEVAEDKRLLNSYATAMRVFGGVYQ